MSAKVWPTALLHDPSVFGQYPSLYMRVLVKCTMNRLKNRRKISSQDLLEILKRIDHARRLAMLNEREIVILGTI